MKKIKNRAIAMMTCGVCALALSMHSCTSGESISTKDPETVVSYKVTPATPEAVEFVAGNYTINQTDEENLYISVAYDGIEVKDYLVTRNYADDGKQLKYCNINQRSLNYSVDEDDPENKSLWVVSSRNTERITEFYDFIYNEKEQGDKTIDLNYKGFTLSDTLSWPSGDYHLRYGMNAANQPVYSILINNQTLYLINYTTESDGRLKEVAIRISEKRDDQYEYQRTVLLSNFKY